MARTVIVYFAILSIFVGNAITISDEQKALIQAKFVEVGAECIKEHPITTEDLLSFKNKIFPDSDNAGCFSACIFNKLGLFDDEGSLSGVAALENVKKIFKDQEELETIEGFLNTCSKVNEQEVSDGEKGCDRARLAFDCFVQNSEQFGFVIDF